MKLFLQTFSLLLPLAVFTACERGEIPIPAHDPGDVITIQVEMGPDYRNQIYYDLGSQSIVSTNSKEFWDLGFEASEAGWHVILNSSRGGAVWSTEQTEFAAISDTVGAAWKHDAPTGNLDSTAFGDYRDLQSVLVLDRGYNSEGIHTGFRKLIVEEVNSFYYHLRTAELDGGGEMVIEIPKDESLNFVSVSLDQNSVVDVEPNKEDWDLVFTQYTYVFDDPPLAYLVVGVISNRNNVSIALDLEKAFEKIAYTDTDSYDFVEALDMIGYNWKEYDFGTGSYQVFSNMNYIIRDTEGRYFKMHFIDFYNSDGGKGAPKMEVQEL